MSDVQRDETQPEALPGEAPVVEPVDGAAEDGAAEVAEGAPESADVGTDGEPADAPAAIIVLTEEALKPVDVDKIVALHADEGATYRVLVPADTDRNMLSEFLDHLSLFEMREALDALKPVDREGAHADAGTALATSLAEFERHGVVVTGEITGDDPMPTLLEEVSRLSASEVVVVTEPHAVEDTFHTDWASRARETLGLPVLHMYAGDWRLG
ncbi:hypothetical protein N865_03615 [Intrasporangium oryzae NRRL B-24470]|uniref:Uncharacterized protein n=1 Tax=Intrasporangium oryzae NRRL B-24470 TaxID=1386089 RepID=W9GCS7_9MICO|nr:hypothetical protein [Intrasporangium oryzae]EWT03012.1 hypothetical protein N865_03615 [Intrasporangium oryzae NRRL B-24470]